MSSSTPTNPFADPEPLRPAMRTYVSSFGLPPPPPPKPNHHEESLYTYSRTAADWIPVTNKDLPSPAASSSSSNANSRPAQTLPYSTPIRIFSWNIDFNSSSTEERTQAQIDYIAEQLGNEAENTIVLLQEVHPWALQILLDVEWVQQTFSVTSTRLAENSSLYGTVTFVGRNLAVAVERVWRLVYKNTFYGRDCVFVDILVGPVALKGDGKGKGSIREKRVLRIGNTHLESLKGGDTIRPKQMAELRSWMEEEDVYAGVVGGDFNAISKCDIGMPEREGFVDLWLASGEEEGREAGNTWGYNTNEDEVCDFPPGRLDKIVGFGKVTVAKEGMKVVARGVMAEIPVYDRESDEPGPVEVYRVFASDHLALTTRIALEQEIPSSGSSTHSADQSTTASNRLST
ncbi:hypothetical protein BJ508DRAFT_412566 [Ascobolus immersus RN42]|uniref:Endonuclease/exonuclease/phosphatase domain-containing protein n=1 Tax=Ascobolus immersus RN42 TaxID=1160509 RepID=A0A3N4IFC4_ASCIM|nr:hypothetical protein BJ508DRAFT_412566 [Ascobolus immersus RN42]